MSHELLDRISSTHPITEVENESAEISEDEINLLLRMVGGYEPPVSGANPNGQGGVTNVTPQVGLRILENVSRGEAPFRPDLGKGGASWFVTEGSPYVGIAPDRSVSVPVEISGMEEAVRFDEARLTQMLSETMAEVRAEAEATYRARHELGDRAFNSRHRSNFARFLQRFAESRMWDKVGQEVGRSSSGIGEVVLEEGSRFSRTPGKFAVVTDAAKITLRGGVSALVESLSAMGHGAEPTVSAAAAEWARVRNVGRVQAVFRYGGRILIVVGLVSDGIRIYRAEDRLKETAHAAGGWAGAFAFSAAFAAWFAPADVAGPGAWVVHGVGTLVAGGIGYFVGSETTQYLYEIVVEED